MISPTLWRVGPRNRSNVLRCSRLIISCRWWRIKLKKRRKPRIRLRILTSQRSHSLHTCCSGIFRFRCGIVEIRIDETTTKYSMGEQKSWQYTPMSATKLWWPYITFNLIDAVVWSWGRLSLRSSQEWALRIPTAFLLWNGRYNNCLGSLVSCVIWVKFLPCHGFCNMVWSKQLVWCLTLGGDMFWTFGP